MLHSLSIFCKTQTVNYYILIWNFHYFNSLSSRYTLSKLQCWANNFTMPDEELKLILFWIFQACVGVIASTKHIITSASCVSSHPMNRLAQWYPTTAPGRPQELAQKSNGVNEICLKLQNLINPVVLKCVKSYWRDPTVKYAKWLNVWLRFAQMRKLLDFSQRALVSLEMVKLW